MPSKGVFAYAYIAANGCSVEFGVPGKAVRKSQMGSWSLDHLEVDSSAISGFFNFTGRFSFKVIQNGSQIAYEYNDINTLTGNLEGGSMTSIRNTKCHRVKGVIVTYGFYDSGSGKAGLTNKDQCWVTVTPDRSNWMGALAGSGSPQAEKLFSTFVLPSPHDCAMNSMQSSDLALRGPGLSFIVAGLTTTPFVGNALAAILAGGLNSQLLSNIIYGISITQKESIEDMLAIGARYFEFRPGRFPDSARVGSGLGDKYYYMHACIPGMAYDEFLDRVLTFLGSHPLEIVVVQLRGDGIMEKVERPSKTEKTDILRAAIAKHSGITAGGINDMKRLTVRQLREQSKRLIVFDREEISGLDQYSSYNDQDYNTLDGSSIIRALDQMNAAGQKGRPFTLLQTQATATNNVDALTYSILSSNSSTSLLMSSKAACDVKTHPWLMKNVTAKLTEPNLVVIMNDFIDGATADAAISLSSRRLNPKS